MSAALRRDGEIAEGATAPAAAIQRPGSAPGATVLRRALLPLVVGAMLFAGVGGYLAGALWAERSVLESSLGTCAF